MLMVKGKKKFGLLAVDDLNNGHPFSVFVSHDAHQPAGDSCLSPNLEILGVS